MMYQNYYNQSDKVMFLQKVQDVAAALGIAADDLMAVMLLESSLNPKAVNRYTGAAGLIQFIPSTAESLGTSTDMILQMSGTDQLDYIYKYLKPYAGRMRDLYDLYFAIFFPAAMGKSDDWVLHTSRIAASTIARQNAGYDLNGDKQITVGEVKAAIDLRLAKKKP